MAQSERRRHLDICGKFLHNAIAITAHTVTTIVLRVPPTIAVVEICLGCKRDRPFLDRTHLVFDEVVPMGRQEATRPDSDKDCIRIGGFPFVEDQVSRHEIRTTMSRHVIRTTPNNDLLQQ